MKDIELEPDCGIGQALLCPRCGGNNLHHVDVQVFCRDEDAPESTCTTVMGTGEATMKMVDSRLNPSGRRDGLKVRFYCETCSFCSHCNRLALTIVQHKGCTFLEWVEDGPEEL